MSMEFEWNLMDDPGAVTAPIDGGDLLIDTDLLAAS